MTTAPEGTHRLVALQKVRENSVSGVSSATDQEIHDDAADATADATAEEAVRSVRLRDATVAAGASSVNGSVIPNPLNACDLDATDVTDATCPLLVDETRVEVRAPAGPLVDYVTTAAQLDAVLPVLCAAPVLGVDTETTGLDPRRDRLRLLQFALDDRVIVVDAFTCPVPHLAPVFTARHLLTFHNAKFDLAFLHTAGLPWPAAPL